MFLKCPGGERRGAAGTEGKNSNTKGTNVMSKRSVDWMKQAIVDLLDQWSHFTVKLPTYAGTFGLAAGEVTANDDDYAWAQWAQDVVAEFDAEAKGRVSFRNKFLEGPTEVTAQAVPTFNLDVEYPAPGGAPPLDGALGRWRVLVDRIKSHPAYTATIGEDLGIAAPEPPPQLMKPSIRCEQQTGGPVSLRIKRDGHDSIMVYCRRGAEAAATLLGTYTSSRIEDTRANLVAGQPELREYTAQYRDKDVLVGDVSDVCRLATKP